MKSKDDKNLLEAYESVINSEDISVGETHLKKEKEKDIAKQQQYDEDLAAWIRKRVSRELPQDRDIREDLVKLAKKLDSIELGKEITKPDTEKEPHENLSRAQYAMSGYNGPNS
jgi:uncharacterized membrane protein